MSKLKTRETRHWSDLKGFEQSSYLVTSDERLLGNIPPFHLKNNLNSLNSYRLQRALTKHHTTCHFHTRVPLYKLVVVKTVDS